jgi:hypothetical protein
MSILFPGASRIMALLRPARWPAVIPSIRMWLSSRVMTAVSVVGSPGFFRS